MPSLIERELMREIRDQKRTASNVHAMKGKRGYVGVMRFPRNNFKKFEKNGKVETYNMFDTMIPFEDFKALPEGEQKRYLIEYRNRFRNSDILKTWKIGSNTLYSYVKKFKLPRAERTDTTDGSKPKVVKQENKKKPSVFEGSTDNLMGDLNKLMQKIEELESQLREKEEKEKQEITSAANTTLIPAKDGMRLSYTGEFSSDQLKMKLDKLSLIIDDEQCNYNVQIFIEENEIEKAS